MTFDDALATKKLRLSWSVPQPGDLPASIVARVFELVCARQPERPGLSQGEALIFESAARRDDGWHLSGRYVFDRDYASQYDATRTGASTRSSARSRCCRRGRPRTSCNLQLQKNRRTRPD